MHRVDDRADVIEWICTPTNLTLYIFFFFPLLLVTSDYCELTLIYLSQAHLIHPFFPVSDQAVLSLFFFPHGLQNLKPVI